MKLQTLSAVLLTVGLCTASFAQDPWGMERHDRYGSGRQPLGPTAGQWIAPYVAKNIVPKHFISSHSPSLGKNGWGFFGDWVENRLYKFNWHSNTVISPPFFQAQHFITSTPAIGPNGWVYIHDLNGAESQQDGKLYAINPNTMDFEWFLATGCHKTTDYDSASPIIGPDGSVVIGSTNGTVWRLNPTTGVPVWTRTGLPGENFHTICFSRDDTKIFVTCSSTMVALNYNDGTTAWSTAPATAGTLGGPSVAPDGTLVCGSSSGRVFRFDPNTGAATQIFQALDQVNAAPAFDNMGNVYLCSYDFRLYSYKLSDNSKNWSFLGLNWNVSAPAVGNDNRIYFLDRTGSFFCVNPNGTLSFMMTFQGGSRGPLTIAPDGSVYVAFTGSDAGIAVVRQTLPSLNSFAAASPSPGVSGTSISIGLSDVPPPNAQATVSSDNSAVVATQQMKFSGKTASQKFTLAVGPVDSQTTVGLTASFNGKSKQASITVQPAPLKSITLRRVVAVGGQDTYGFVYLAGKAGPSGTTVTLDTSDTNLATVDPSVTVPSGAVSTTYNIHPAAVTSDQTVTINAHLGAVTKSVQLTIAPVVISTLSVKPATVTAGNSSQLTVKLTGPATAGGITVDLYSDHPYVTVPAHLTFAQGESVKVVNVTATAFDNGTVKATLTGVHRGYMPHTVLTVVGKVSP